MTTSAAPSARGTAVWPVLAAVGLLAGITAAGIGALSLAEALTATGLPDLGPATTVGLPFVRAAGEIAAVIAVGSFMFAAFFVPPQENGCSTRPDTGRCGWAPSPRVSGRCARPAGPADRSDVSGQPLRDHLDPIQIWSVASLVDTAGAWRWTAFLAFIVTVGGVAVLRWSWTPILLGGALLTLVPLGLTGHSSAGGAHDLATNSLLIHLVAGALWAGGLLALLSHALRGGDHADLAARRFSRVAFWCFVAMALSGVINALVRIRFGDLFSTEYGRLVLAGRRPLDAGVIGWWQRRSGWPHCRPIRRPAAADPAGAVRGPGLRADVRRRRRAGPHPATAAGAAQPSATEVALGYDLAGPPTLARILFDWRFDLVFGTAAIIFAAVYVAGVIRLRRRGDVMAGRTHRGVAARLRAAAVHHVVGPGPLHAGDVQHAHDRPHAAVDAHADPAGAGAPVTLALRALPTAGKGQSARAARMAAGRAAQQVVEVLHPPGRRDADVRGGLLRAVLRRHLQLGGQPPRAHVPMNLHFLMSGYLFYWVVIGVDPRRGNCHRWPRSAWSSPPFRCTRSSVVMMGMPEVLAKVSTALCI